LNIHVIRYRQEGMMSKADLDRFVADLKTNTKLRDAVVKGAGGVQAAINVAKSHGYNITLDEARGYMREQAANLSDKELDALAGGKGSSPAPKPKPAPSSGPSAVTTVMQPAMTVIDGMAVEVSAIQASGQVVVVAEGVVIAT
jgi:predicted ribosomally synthesized peptide with nif11-like leader